MISPRSNGGSAEGEELRVAVRKVCIGEGRIVTGVINEVGVIIVTGAINEVDAMAGAFTAIGCGSPLAILEC